MSIFKTRGFILKINKISGNNFLYTIFTYDYGIIKASKKDSKKEKTLDLGYLINFEIETKEKRDIHKMKNIKISLEFNYQNKDFSTINAYLVLLSTILKKCPLGAPIYEIMEVIETVVKYEKINETKLILAKIKIINILGELNINHKNTTISKILKFINNNRISEIIRLNGISDYETGLLRDRSHNLIPYIFSDSF